ncbi:MAG: hypothetical protein ABSG52_06885 [Terriglobales bacterium]|jgi:hypothetical protein
MLRRIVVAIYALGLAYLLIWVPFTTTLYSDAGPARILNDPYGYHSLILENGYGWNPRTSEFPDVSRIVLRVFAWTAFSLFALLLLELLSCQSVRSWVGLSVLRRRRPSAPRGVSAGS